MDFTIDEPLTVASVVSWLSRGTYNYFEVNQRVRENTALNVHEHTLSKAIGRDNFSIGADVDDDDEFDGIEMPDDMEVVAETVDGGRSEYNINWLLVADNDDGNADTAAAVIDNADGATRDDGWSIK